MGEVAIKKFERIKSLRCYDQVEEMIYSGYPMSAVAHYIQNRMGEYQHVKRVSLMEMLRLYREHLKEKGGLVQRSLPRVFLQAEKKFSDKLEELKRLEERYQAMEYRFDVMHAEERMTGVINPQVDKIDRRMCEIITKMHGIKMDLGLVGSRDLGTINISAERLEYVRSRYGEGAAKALDDPVSRGRVLAALNAIKRSGQLRDSDGSPMDIHERMNLSEEEAGQVVDVDYEVEDGDELPDGEEWGHGGDEDDQGEHGGDEPLLGEDLSKPADDMVEDDEEGSTEDQEPDSDFVDPPAKETEMEPVRRSSQGLPPGPMKPSVRGNVKKRWTTKDQKKK